MQRPEYSEYDAYYRLYVDKVPDGDIFETLDTSGQHTRHLLNGAPEHWGSFRYEPGKWTLGEVIGHLVDTERVFGYRALCFARGETAELPSMDQNIYAAGSNAADRDLVSLLAEHDVVRQSTLALLRSFAPSVHLKTGTASGCPFSVRTFAWIIAGHEIHHRKVIEDRYVARLQSP